MVRQLELTSLAAIWGIRPSQLINEWTFEDLRLADEYTIYQNYKMGAKRPRQ